MDPHDQALKDRVDSLLAGRSGLRVLDAGCGWESPFIPAAAGHTTGIDVVREQIERNPHLDERIEGDVQAYDFGDRRFDVIVCWDVLEHLPHPERALDSFRRLVDRGGLIVLGMPHALSVKGLVTKLTPYRFHVWMWDRFLGGTTPECAPFPTYMRLRIAPRGIARFARRHGLTVEYVDAFEGDTQELMRRKLHVTGPVWRIVRGLVSVLSLGRVTAAATDVRMVLRAPVEAGGGA